MSTIGLRATPVSIAALATAGGTSRDQPRIERHRDDVVGPEFRPRPVGGGDLVGHVLARELGERLRGGDLHLHVDGGGAHVERAAEDVGEAEHVVDLVRIVGAAGRHDGVVAHRRHLLGGDLRVGIGHGEDDRLGRHRLAPCPASRRPWPRGRRTTSAPSKRLGQRARLGLRPRRPTSTGSCPRCGPRRSRPWCRTG